MIELGSSRYRLTAFALAFGSFLIFCNLYLFQPMLPVFAASDGISETRANWLLAAATLGLSFSLVPWAVLSERIGRRPVMLASLWMLPLVGLAIASTSSFLGGCSVARFDGRVSGRICGRGGRLHGRRVFSQGTGNRGG